MIVLINFLPRPIAISSGISPGAGGEEPNHRPITKGLKKFAMQLEELVAGGELY